MSLGGFMWQLWSAAAKAGWCILLQMLLALVPAGGHIVTTTDCYRRTRQFIQTVRCRAAVAVPPLLGNVTDAAVERASQHQTFITHL
jgi:cystathionine beta-lyase/cystathionine gamma-synthase